MEVATEALVPVFASKVIAELEPEWARFMAARFNGEVWLAGSSLWSPTPRDVDIRIVISAHEFGNRYDTYIPIKPKEWWDLGISQRWIDDMAKMNRVLSTMYWFNSDVQVWPRDTWNPPTGVCAPVLLAAPSPRWFNPTAAQFAKFKPAGPHNP